MIIKLDLEAEIVQIILNILAEQPYSQVFKIIESIQSQAKKQINAD